MSDQQQGKSTLTIELDTTRAKTSADDFTAKLREIDDQLSAIDTHLKDAKKWKVKFEAALNPFKVQYEFEKVQKAINDSRRKITLDSELKFSATNEINKIQGAVNKTNRKIILDIELNTKGVKGELKKVQDQVTSASSKIQIGADTSNAKAGMVALTGEMKTQLAEISRMAQAVTAALNTQNERRVQNARKAQDRLNTITQESNKPYKNIGSVMAASAINTRPMEEAMRRRRELDEADLARKSRNEALLAQNELRASQNRVANYQREMDAKRRMDETYNASKKSLVERQAKSTVATLKNTPDTKLATFKATDVSAFADIGAIKAQGKEIEAAYKQMYDVYKKEAASAQAVIQASTKASIESVQKETKAKIDAIMQETSLTSAQRKAAVGVVEASSKQIINSLNSIPAAAKQTWAAQDVAMKEYTKNGVAATKAATDAQIAEYVRRGAADKRVYDEQQAAAAARISDMERRLRSSGESAKYMVDEFNKLGTTQNYEVVKNLETALDKLRSGFANIKFGDNTSQLSAIQDKLASAYAKATKAAELFSNGDDAAARHMIANVQNEIATLEALRKQILSTGAAAQSLSGRSFMSDSLRSAGEQIEMVASRLRELGSFTRFDSVNALKSQIDSIAVSIQKIPNIGSADLVKALDNITLAYKHLEDASIAATKGQETAFANKMTAAKNALTAAQKVEAEVNRFSNAKLQTSQLSAAFEADAKKAIQSAKEVGKIKMSTFDDEVNAYRQSISAQQRADSEYMKHFEAQNNQRRASFKATVDAQTRDAIDAIKAREAEQQRVLSATSRLGESRVGTIEAVNTRLGRTQAAGAFRDIPNTQTAGVQQATQQAIRQQGLLQNIISETSRAHVRAMAQNASSTLLWIRNLWLVQKAFEMIGSALSGITSAFTRVKDVALTSQKMVTVMSVIAGSTQAAREEVEWLRKESDRLGISFEAAATPFAKFAAAAKGMFDPTMLHEMFTQLGKVSVAMHLDQVETKGVFLAIQQMASKGKVSLEELRLQFAERIPGAMTIAADSMDMTMTQFVKSVSNGQMMTQDFLPKFLKNLESAFGQAADIASRSLVGSLARLENSMFAMWEKIGEGGLAESIRRVADKYAAFVNNNTKLFEQLGLKAGEVFETLADKLLLVISNESSQQKFLGFIDTAKAGFINLTSILERIVNLMITIDKFTPKTSFNPMNHPVVETMALPYRMLKQATGATNAPDYIPGVDKGVLITDAKGKTSVREYTQSLRDAEAKRAFIETQEDISKLNQSFGESSTKVREFSSDYKGAMHDIQQAGEAALKPKFYSEHMEALDNYLAQITKAKAELKSLADDNAPSVFKKAPQDLSAFRTSDTSWPTTALLGANDAIAGYGAIAKAQKDSTYDRVQQIDAITAAVEKLNEARSKKIVGSDDYTILSNQINILTKEGNALKQADAEAKAAIDNYKGMLLDATTGAAKEFRYVQAELTETTDKFAALGEEIAKIQSKKIDFEAMTPSQLITSIDDLSKATSDATPKIADYQKRMGAIITIQGDMDALMRQNPGSEELTRAYNAVALAAENTREEINKGMDTFKRQSSELDRATKAMDAYTEQMYKAKTYMSEMRQLQANKGQVDQLSKQGDISGLTAIMNKAGGSVAPLTEQLLKAKQLEEQTKGNLLEHNKAIENRIDLESKLQSAISQQKDAADAILQLERKTSEAKQDQYQTELRILNLREKFKAKTDFASMTRDQLAAYKEDFTPSKLSVNKIGVTVDTEDLKAQIEGVAPVKIKAEKLDLTEIIRDAAKLYNVPEALIRAVAKTESGFNPKAESSAGARGIMQLMAPTAASYGVTDRDDPRQSIMGGTAFLKDLLKKYKGNISLAAAAYNAGEPRVDKAKGIPNIKETQEYVKLVTAEYDKLQGVTSSPIVIDVDASGVTDAADDVTRLLHIVKGETVKMSLFDQILTQTNQLRETLDRIDQIEKAAEGRNYTKQETAERKALVTVLEAQSGWLDKDLAKLNALNKAWDAQNLKIWENAHARENALNIEADRQQLENVTRNQGTNAIPTLNSMYDFNQAKLSDLKDYNAVLTSMLGDVSSAGVQEGQYILNLEERTRLANEQAKVQDQINRLDTKNNDILSKTVDLRRQENQILQASRDELRNRTMENRYGKDGALRLQMKLELSPDAFKEWDANRLKLQFENFIDEAGLSADGITNSFSNAFQQILVDGQSFSETMQNLFQDMANRIISSSINLIAKNLEGLMSGGGSWAQIGLGVVGVGIGLLGQWASKKPVKTTSQAQDKSYSTQYLSGNQAIADSIAREQGFQANIDTARMFNNSVNQLISALKLNTDAVTSWIGQLGTQLTSTTIYQSVSKLFEPITNVTSKVFESASDLFASVFSGAQDLFAAGINTVTNAVGLGSVVSSSSAAANATGTYSSVGSSASVGLSFVALGVSAWNLAESFDKGAGAIVSSSLSLVSSIAAVGAVFATAVASSAAGVAAGSAAAGAAVGAATAVAAALAAVAAVLAIIAVIVALVMKPKKPNYWMNMFSPNEGTFDPKQNTFSEDNSFYTRTGNKSAFIGTETPLGLFEISSHELSMTSDEMVKSYKDYLLAIKSTATTLVEGINKVDAANGEAGKTMEYYTKQLVDNRIAVKQYAENFELGKGMDEMFTKVFDVFAASGSKSGKVVNEWFDMLMGQFEAQAKAAPPGASAAIATFIGKFIDPIMMFPENLVQLIGDSITAISKENPVEDLMKQALNMALAYSVVELAFAELGSTLTDVGKVQVVNFIGLLGKVGIGFEDAALNLIAFANSFASIHTEIAKVDLGKAIADDLNNFISSLKTKGFGKEETAGALSSYTLLASSAADLGLKTTDASIKELAITTAQQAKTNVQAANEAINHAIAQENLGNQTREAAIQTLLMTNKLDENTIAAANYGVALTKLNQATLESIQLINAAVTGFGGNLGSLGVSLDATVNAGNALVATFGSLSDAMSFFDSLGQTFLSDANYLAGQKAVAQQSFDTAKRASGKEFTSYTIEQFIADIRNPANLGAYIQLQSTTGKSPEQAKADKAQFDNLTNLARSAEAVFKANKAYEESIAGLKAVTEQALTPVAAGLGAVDTSSQSFTNSMLYLAQAFGSAQAAAQSLSDSMSLVYSAQEMSSKGVNIARAGFDTAATKAGLVGLRPEDAQAGLNYIMRNYIETGKGAEMVTYGGVTAMAEDWRRGLTTVLKPLDTATKELISNQTATAQSVLSMGGSTSDFSSALDYGTDKLSSLADTVNTLNTSMSSLRTPSQNSARDTSLARAQNLDIFNASQMQDIWQYFGVKTVEEAQYALKNQAQRPDFVQAQADEATFAAWLNKSENSVVKQLWNTFASNTASILAPAIQQQDQMAQAQNASLEGQIQNATDFNALLSDIDAQIASLKESDIGKIFVDLNKGIKDLEDEAKKLGGEIPKPKLDELKSLKIDAGFKDFFGSFIEKWKELGQKVVTTTTPVIYTEATAKEGFQNNENYDFGFGQRYDLATNSMSGPNKGLGWLGRLQNAEGGAVTEYSIDVNIDGKSFSIPSIVPTLTKDEISTVLSASLTEAGLPDQIIQKAVDFAKGRLAQGLSPFAAPWESPDAVSYLNSRAGTTSSTSVQVYSLSETQKGIKGILDPYDKAFKDLQEWFDKANETKPGTYTDQWLADMKAGLQSMKDLDISEYVKGITEEVSKEFNNIGKSDLQINLDGIVEWMNEQLQVASDMATAGLPGAGSYKAQVISTAQARGRAATQDIIDEYQSIGATDYAKSLNEINKWLSETLVTADLIAASWGITTEQAITGIYAIRDARIKALDEERQKIIDDAKTTYDRAESNRQLTTVAPIAAELETQLWGMRDSFLGVITEIIQAGGTFEDISGVYNIAMRTGIAAVEQARKDIETKFKQIANAISDATSSIAVNKLRISVGDTAAQTEADRYQRERALKVLNDLNNTTFDEQMQAINDLQSATMSRYDREKSAIQELTDFVQNLQDYVKSLMVNKDLSTLSNQGRMEEALKQYQETFAAATSPIESEARKKARGELTSKADVYLQEARAYYASSPQYADVFNKITSELSGVADTGKSPQEQLVDLNTSMLAELTTASEYLAKISDRQTQAKITDLAAINQVIDKIRTDFLDQITILVDKLGSLEMQIKVNFLGDLTDKQLDTITALYTGHPTETFNAVISAMFGGELTTDEGLRIFDRIFEKDPMGVFTATLTAWKKGDLTDDRTLLLFDRMFEKNPLATFTATLSSVRAGDLTTDYGIVLFDRMFEKDPKATFSATLTAYTKDLLTSAEGLVLFDRMFAKDPYSVFSATLKATKDGILTNDEGLLLFDRMFAANPNTVIDATVRSHLYGIAGIDNTVALFNRMFATNPTSVISATITGIGNGLLEDEKGLNFINTLLSSNPVLKQAVITGLMDRGSSEIAMNLASGKTLTPEAVVTVTVDPGGSQTVIDAISDPTREINVSVVTTLGNSDQDAIALATLQTNTLYSVVYAGLHTDDPAIVALATQTANTINTVIRATSLADETTKRLAFDTAHTINTLVTASNNANTDTLALIYKTGNTINTVVSAMSTLPKDSEVYQLAFKTQNAINTTVAAWQAAGSDPIARQLATAKLNELNAAVLAYQAAGTDPAAVALATKKLNEVTSNVKANLDATSNVDAVKLGVAGITNSTVNAKAVLTIDDLLRNSMLAWNKDEVAWLYIAMKDGIEGTKSEVYGLRSPLSSINSTLSTISSTLSTYLARLPAIEANTGSATIRLSQPLTVRSQTRSAAYPTYFAMGGIADKPSIFGEAGPEAAVPLPDGRTIPVTLSGNVPTSNVTSDEAYAEMQAQTKELRQLRKENGQKQDVLIQRIAQLERKLAQIEANGALAGAM